MGHLIGRVILSACSPYFHAMFTSELLEARLTEVPIRDIDEDAVDLLVNFCYTSEITIEESNVQTLLPAGELIFCFKLSTTSCLQYKLHTADSNGITVVCLVNFGLSECVIL